jgi:hypothetical protein
VCHDEVVVECDVEKAGEAKTWLEKTMVDGMEERELGYPCSFIRARFM